LYGSAVASKLSILGVGLFLVFAGVENDVPGSSDDSVVPPFYNNVSYCSF
jgi:hypothetical protein